NKGIVGITLRSFFSALTRGIPLGAIIGLHIWLILCLSSGWFIYYTEFLFKRSQIISDYYASKIVLILSVSFVNAWIVFGGVFGAGWGWKEGQDLAQAKGLPFFIFYIGSLTSFVFGLYWVFLVSLIKPINCVDAMLFEGIAVIIGTVSSGLLGFTLFWRALRKRTLPMPKKDKIAFLLTFIIGAMLVSVALYFLPSPRWEWLANWINMTNLKLILSRYLTMLELSEYYGWFYFR
ncbi:MAG: hypothetical protein ACPL7E_03380, partial [bacterium]